MRRKLLALLLAAAMAISLLAGCGGGKALSQVIVDLLDNLYSNVSVEADSDLTAALKQAAAEGGTEEEILSRMIEILNHKGGSITFTLLGSGQQGEHGVTLYFQPGTDPDAAARNALAQWAGTLGTLPDDGSYQADVAMIETENGYYIALDVEVVKAGKPDKPDKDDDEPETKPEQDKGYSYDTESGTYTVKEADGLQELFNDKKNDINKDTVIKLTTDQTITGTALLTGTFSGTLNGNDHTITMEGTREQGLFNEIGEEGKVLNVDIEVSGTISKDGGTIGAVAGTNNGEISGCDVTGGTIESTNKGDVGGIVGDNRGTIEGCSSAAAVKNGQNTGGIAGSNSDGGSITDCCSTGTVTSGNSYSNTGGVVGYNEGATITACYSTVDITSSGKSSSFTGGVAGANIRDSDNDANGKIIACYHADGEVSGTTAGGVVGWNSTSSAVIACYHADGEVSGGTAGGVVGENSALHGLAVITACYWSGQIKINNTVQNVGHGIGYNNGTAPSDNGTTKVTGDVTWQMAVNDMNTELEKEGSQWRYELTGGSTLPSLTKTNP